MGNGMVGKWLQRLVNGRGGMSNKWCTVVRGGKCSKVL